MARPIVREDFTSVMQEDGGFPLSQKNVISKLFKQGVIGKVLTSDQTVTSSTTLTSVSDLRFNVKKGKKYRIHGVLFADGTGATGGIKATMTHSGQSSPTLIGTTTIVSASAVAAEALTTASATGSAVGALIVYIDGYFVPDANGTITVQFAQNTSDSTGAVLKAGSFVRLHKA